MAATTSRGGGKKAPARKAAAKKAPAKKTAARPAAKKTTVAKKAARFNRLDGNESGGQRPTDD